MPKPRWTTYLAAVLTLTVAALASFIANRQWRTAQNKLDLFDKRLAVHGAARRPITSIATSGKSKEEELRNFLIKC